MRLNWRIRCFSWVCCLTALLMQNCRAVETESERFRGILELAELGPEALTELGPGPTYSDEDWQLLAQVFSRLLQFGDVGPPSPFLDRLPPAPLSEATHRLGEIVRIGGVVEAVEELPLPARFAEMHDWKSVYRCQLRFPHLAGSHREESQRDESQRDEANGDIAIILTTRVPQGWRGRKTFHEFVQVRGVVVRDSIENEPALILTNHLAWYPSDGVPTGQQLLARHSMDVALLDEVRHRQPFVKPEISREGEAFYAALTALDQVDQQELVRLARENVASKAAAWRALQPELAGNHHALKAKLASESDVDKRDSLQREVKAARTRLGLAAAVMELSEVQRSSVAPLFLQPEQEVGELVIFEGVARRALRIAVADQPHLTEHNSAEGNPSSAESNPGSAENNINAYYELEVFTTDSQNLPIVCCLLQLPTDFPTGDEIREPVRIAGVFFKNWRYRSRKLVGTAGETGRQRQMYTPVLLGKRPTWLSQTANRNSRWALWGGIAFLTTLVVLWISMAWRARRDAAARAALRPPTIIDL